jgi:signal transduction histidine kinase
MKMKTMKEPGSVSFKSSLRFGGNTEWYSPLSYPKRSGCQERKESMTFDHELSTTPERAVVFTDHQPQKELGVTNTAHATLQEIAQQNERKRIAQELHDTLLQGFTGVALKLDALTNSLPAELSQTKEQLQRILQQTDEYLAEARRSIWKLRSNTLKSTEDLARGLVQASERALAGTGIQLDFSVCGAEGTIKSVSEDHLLRICEEAIANAVKHARPTKVDVTLEFNSEIVRLWVRDDGCGFNPSRLEETAGGHLGLLGIKERVEALSGILSIDSSPGRGTSLWVMIPTGGTTRPQRGGSV